MKILHIIQPDKFIPDFVDFINENFDNGQHLFLVIGNNNIYSIKNYPNIVFMDTLIGVKKKLRFICILHQYNKIILHNIFNRSVVNLLLFLPWILKRCYWVMWGGDLYHYLYREKGIKSDLHEWARRFVIKRLGHLVTYILGDVNLAREWYGAKGKYHECFIYPSNLYKEYAIPDKQGSSKNILLGNSGDPSNNHFELLDKLLPYKDGDIKIYCPLSYGDEHHIQDVVKKGHALFGSKFMPLLEFMAFEKYLELLGQIDIAMFGHKRQQAMGNTITLLGLGKKVYMRNDVSSWGVFKNIGITVFNVEENDFSSFNESLMKENQLKVADFFSKDLLVKQWQEIVNG